MFVRIGSMLDAATFLVAQIPPARPNPNSRIQKLLELETELRQMFNAPADFLITPHHFPEKRGNPELVRGTLVAVRREVRSRFWHRGKIIKVYHFQQGTHADVQLIDYGDMVHNVAVLWSVRKLPKRLIDVLEPMAFELKLKDIVPVELKTNLLIGMTNLTETPASNWSPAANALVRKHLLSSHSKAARVFNWVKGKDGTNVFGHVELLHFIKMVYLNCILVIQKFGIRFAGNYLFARNDNQSGGHALKQCHTYMTVDRSRVKNTTRTFDDNDDEATSSNEDGDATSEQFNLRFILAPIEEFEPDPDVIRRRLMSPAATSLQLLSLSLDQSNITTTLSLDDHVPDWSILQKEDTDSTRLSSSSAAIREKLVARNKRRFVFVPGGINLTSDMHHRLKMIPDGGIGPKQIQLPDSPELPLAVPLTTTK